MPTPTQPGPLETDDADQQEDGGDWFWQCHICAYLNPLPRHFRSFAGIPLSLSQPCTNLAAPCPLAHHSSLGVREPAYAVWPEPGGFSPPYSSPSGGYDMPGSLVVPTSWNFYRGQHALEAGSGLVTIEGKSRPCGHRRCEGCYDLDGEGKVLRFCGDADVNARRYREWYEGFGFADGVVPVVFDGGVKTERTVNLGAGVCAWDGASDATVAGGPTGPEERVEANMATGSPGRQRPQPNLLVEGLPPHAPDGGGSVIRSEEGSDQDREDDEDLPSTSSHGEIRPITYIHRGSQEGGGMSNIDSESHDGDAADDDDDDDEDEDGERKPELKKSRSNSEESLEYFDARESLSGGDE